MPTTITCKHVQGIRSLLPLLQLALSLLLCSPTPLLSQALNHPLYMAIHIKKSHKGLLHKNLGIPQGEKIPASKLSVKKGDSAAVKKRKVFAQNAKKWHHADYGDQITPINPHQDEMPSIYNPVGQEDIHLDQLHPSYGVNQQFANPPQQTNWGHAATAALLGIDALIPPEVNKMPVVRPGMTYRQNPYGTGSQAIMKYGGAVDAGDTQWISEYNYGNDGMKMYNPMSYAEGGMYVPTSYENGGCMDCGGKMPGGGQVGSSQPNRYAPWGSLAGTIQKEGWRPSLWNNQYTEYTTPYNAAGNNVLMNGKDPNGNVVIRGQNNGLFDIIVRDQTGKKKDSYIKQGIDAQHAHDYFTSPQSTINQRVQQLAPYSASADSKAMGRTMEQGGEIYRYGEMFTDKGLPRGYAEWGADVVPLEEQYGIDDGLARHGKKMPKLPKEAPNMAEYGQFDDGGYIEDAKSGNWIKGAVNPKHKGFCTPMTKSTCTPRRKAFAMTMKKHHGFHKKDDGGKLMPYYKDGGEYNLSKDEISHLISQGYDIELL